MARVRKLILSAADYERLMLHANGLMTDLVMALEDVTGVSDLRVKAIEQGDPVVMWVEAPSFGDLSCCWKGSAPRWTDAEALLRT